VSTESAYVDLAQVAVIVPALNEAQSLSALLPVLKEMQLGQIIICDNGSTDDTRKIVETNGALWVHEAKRGYGAACFAGMEHLASSSRIVVFLDADLSDDASLLRSLVEPIANDECDFVVGSRVARLREPGSMTFPQVFANWLFPLFIRGGWGYRYTDMGPFRAIRRSSLEAVDMQDRAYGWTIEMQIRAVELSLRIRELPVSYRKRTGRSKISGTIRGVVLAAYWITRTCGMLWLTKRRRLR
jgi:glycosyltransferase involved in cell wall biosynthesis